MNVSFRFAAANEYDRLSRFLNDHWASNHVYCRQKPLFDWTFLNNPRWNRDSYCFVVAESGAELVGMLGGIPFLMNAHGANSQGVWIANYVIRPDFRRGPLALQLLGQFRKPPFETTIASGINPATATIYKVLRGSVLPVMPRHFAVFPEGRATALSLLHSVYPRRNIADLEEWLKPFQLAAFEEPHRQFSKAIPDNWDEHGWEHWRKTTVGAARDRVFLEWRYRHHPLFRYCFAAVEEDRTSLAVWRMETIQQRSDTGSNELGKIARIVEFLPSSPQTAGRLLHTVFKEAAGAGAFAADYYGYHGEIGQWLTAAGFPRTSTHPDGALIPSRFQPLDGKDGNIHCAMFLQEGLPACLDDATCPWYWTKADSDQDRPN
ncbi:MAG: hypothetical protein JNK87_26400 [Bryobacterales bacterium]|nr:hypothetical protein [Bryobacterales bacterium]